MQTKLKSTKFRNPTQGSTSALLTFIAGLGFLTLVVAGAVSQLWHYPFVRAALLRATDDLMFATLFGYFGTFLLNKKRPSVHMALRVLKTVTMVMLLLVASFLLLRALIPLGSMFSDCINIENMPPACNIQIEEYRSLSPEKRKELSVL